MLHVLAQPGISQNPDSTSADKHALMNRIEKRWTGDLQKIRQQRRLIRVLVSYNDTNFFVALGEKRGMEYELYHPLLIQASI